MGIGGGDSDIVGSTMSGLERVVETIEVGSSFEILTLGGRTKSPSRVVVVRVVVMCILNGEFGNSLVELALVEVGAWRKASYCAPSKNSSESGSKGLLILHFSYGEGEGSRIIAGVYN